MCGIAGFWHKSARPDPDVLLGMTNAISHRGPDDSGIWIDSEHGLALGHRRLSIIDLSAEGRQPMTSSCGRYVVVFNGEIYNFPELRDDLENEAGIRSWRGRSDTEILLAAVAFWGVEEALKRFNGMFAFALWDRQNASLTLARDRMGEKPLYYGFSNDCLLFGSELKALRKHPCWKGVIDEEALADYLSHGYIPAPKSIYRCIKKLLPAHYINFKSCDDSAVLPKYYWSLLGAAEAGIAAPFRGDCDELLEELDRRMSKAVKLRMISDVPLGAFLSGGCDSSAVVALMQKQSQQPVRTFSIGFTEKDYNEAPFAAAVAEHLKTDHTELYLPPQAALDIIPDLPRIWDEPFGDSSQIPTLLVSHMARRHVTVSLSGDGGDELFGGYHHYFYSRNIWNRLESVPLIMRRLTGKAGAAFTEPLSKIIRSGFGYSIPFALQLASRLGYYGRAVAEGTPDAIHRAVLTLWHESEWPLNNCRQASLFPDLLCGRQNLGAFENRMFFADLSAYLPDDILVKVDRASMAVSLESRAPLLDHTLVEFSWRIPIEYKMRENQGKWIFKRLLHRYLKPEMIERPKMGFGVPVYKWLRGPLAEWAEDLLNERKIKNDGFFDPKIIRRMWHEHKSGIMRWEVHLWALLMFQAWLASVG